MPRLAALLLMLSILSGCATQPPWETTDPDRQAEAYANLGMGYLEQGQLERALRDFQRALDVRPRHPKALHGMALTLQQQQENQLAEQYFRQTLRVAPDQTLARNNYAAFLFSQSRYDEARRELERASQDIFYANRALIFENLGYVALEQGKTAEAIQSFNRSLGLNRASINPHRELLRLYLSQGQLTQAQQHWQFLRNAGDRDTETLQQALILAQRTGNRTEVLYIDALLKATPENNQEPAHRGFQRP